MKGEITFVETFGLFQDPPYHFFLEIKLVVLPAEAFCCISGWLGPSFQINTFGWTHTKNWHDRPFHYFRALRSGYQRLFEVQERIAMDFEAQNLWKGRSRRVLLVFLLLQNATSCDYITDNIFSQLISLPHSPRSVSTQKNYITLTFSSFSDWFLDCYI